MFAEISSFNEKGEPKPFSLVFCTADKKRKTGGDIHMISRRTPAMDMLRQSTKRILYTESQVVRVVGKTEDNVPKLAVLKTGEPSHYRNPHHYENSTINIMILTSKATRKIHPRLITHFNDKKVLW